MAPAAATVSEAAACMGCPAVADGVLVASAATVAAVECAVVAEAVAAANRSDRLPLTTTTAMPGVRALRSVPL